MKHIVIDTTVLISLYKTNDSNHNKTLKAIKKLDSHSPTYHLNDLIVAETHTVFLLKTKDIEKTKLINHRLNSDQYQLHPFDNQLKSLTYNIFLSQKKPHLSIADASLIALSKTLKTKHLFTLDQNLINAAHSHHLSPITT